MPNVDFTKQVQKYLDDQIEAGSYKNLSEAVCAGVTLLMEHDPAWQYGQLKADLETAATLVEHGDFVELDVCAFEPDAFFDR